MGVAGSRPLYTFIDEGGDFNFSPTGTKYFTMTGVTVARPFPLQQELSNLRFDLLEAGVELEYFHASTDRQNTRDQVFALIQSEYARYRVDSVIVEKSKTGPSLRPIPEMYPRMLGYLLSYLIRGTDWSRWSELIVIADRIEERRRRTILEGAVKSVLKSKLPAGVPFRVLHHESRSSYGLQVADYFNWAIYKKWKDGDTRSYTLVRPSIYSEFDIFRLGTRHYY